MSKRAEPFLFVPPPCGCNGCREQREISEAQRTQAALDLAPAQMLTLDIEDVDAEIEAMLEDASPAEAWQTRYEMEREAHALTAEMLLAMIRELDGETLAQAVELDELRHELDIADVEIADAAAEIERLHTTPPTFRAWLTGRWNAFLDFVVEVAYAVR